ncbi:MAG: SCO family protein [Opitutales bacterium]|jgi:protein SCO1|nr:SCO family protein [Opitutales bacterium]
MTLSNNSGLRGIGARIARFLTGAGLPLFLASAALVYEILIFGVLFAPDNWGTWTSFANNFKLWCFGYDPQTGGLAWSEVVVMQLEPLFVLGLSVIVSRRQVMGLSTFAKWRPHLATMASGVTLSSIAMIGLYLFATSESTDEIEFPFPGKRIRTELVPPSFQLTDQMGNSFDIEEHRGDVVIVTGVYALCSSTCPLILAELKSLLDELSPEERERAQIVAITLNPENETPEDMVNYISGYGFEYPELKYLNGDPGHVRKTLKKLQISRSEYPEYGIIDHSNLFLLIDAEGRIAYRLTLDERHQSWLRGALKELATEATVLASRESGNEGSPADTLVLK